MLYFFFGIDRGFWGDGLDLVWSNLKWRRGERCGLLGRERGENRRGGNVEKGIGRQIKGRIEKGDIT